jgi:hypothetical protein
LRFARKWFGGDRITFKFQPSDDELVAQIASIGIPTSSAQLQGTLRAININALVQQLQPWLQHHLGGRTAVHGLGTEEWSFDGPFGEKMIHGREAIVHWFFDRSEDSLKIPLMMTDDMNYV